MNQFTEIFLKKFNELRFENEDINDLYLNNPLLYSFIHTMPDEQSIIYFIIQLIQGLEEKQKIITELYIKTGIK